MSRAHALLVTSVREGWGLVVDEAAACGTPAIAYDVAGLRDSVPAAGGVLVPPNPEALASQALTRLAAGTGSVPRRGWRGGARPWDEVAAASLEQIEAEMTSGLVHRVGTP
jgi:glycosyltransferase involved in cell wall biosynthesis